MSTPYNRREPVAALAFSLLVPGLGQLYNGPTEKEKGLKMLWTEASLIATSWFVPRIAAADTCSTSDVLSGSCSRSAYRFAAYAVTAGFVVNAITSAYDAYVGADRLNKAHGLALAVVPEGHGRVSASVMYRLDPTKMGRLFER